MEQRSCWKASH